MNRYRDRFRAEDFHVELRYLSTVIAPSVVRESRTVQFYVTMYITRVACVVVAGRWKLLVGCKVAAETVRRDAKPHIARETLFNKYEAYGKYIRVTSLVIYTLPSPRCPDLPCAVDHPVALDFETWYHILVFA